jgi:hypothetical protein
MAQDAPEVVITPEDLEIGAADARQSHPDQGFVWSRNRLGEFLESYLPVSAAV